MKYGKRFAAQVARAKKHPQYHRSGVGLSFGNALAKRMERDGVSSAELAERIDVTEGYVDDLLRGDVDLTSELIGRLAEAMTARLEIVFSPK